MVVTAGAVTVDPVTTVTTLVITEPTADPVAQTVAADIITDVVVTMTTSPVSYHRSPAQRLTITVTTMAQAIINRTYREKKIKRGCGFNAVTALFFSVGSILIS